MISLNVYAWLIARDFCLSTVYSMYSVYCQLMCDHIAAVIVYALVMLTELLIYVLYFSQKPLTIKSDKDDQLTRVKTFDQGRQK